MITLFDGYAIRVDEYNYTLVKEMGETIDKKTGEQKQNYKSYGFYGTLSAALKALTGILSREELKARESTLTEAVDTIKRNNDRLMGMLEEIKKAMGE